MAGSEEVGVDYNAVLNDRIEVKIALQRERKRELFCQSCKVHFIAFQANENELRAAYRCTCQHVQDRRTNIKISR